jgi:hypothetical protein
LHIQNPPSCDIMISLITIRWKLQGNHRYQVLDSPGTHDFSVPPLPSFSLSTFQPLSPQRQRIIMAANWRPWSWYLRQALTCPASEPLAMNKSPDRWRSCCALLVISFSAAAETGQSHSKYQYELSAKRTLSLALRQ